MVKVESKLLQEIEVVLEKISKDIDNINMGEILIWKMLISIYHFKNIDTVKSREKINFVMISTFAFLLVPCLCFWS